MIPEADYFGEKCFLFAICTRWQCELLKRYSKLLFLDTTHNTCFAPDCRDEKASLSTNMIRHDEADCGFPVAFFLSNSESRWSLLEGLKWLSNFASLNEIPKIIIDYCQADLAAINMAFTSLETRFCHWHMFKAMQSQTNENIRSLSTENFQMTKRSAITDFNMLVCSRTVKDFGDVCTNYQVRYGRFTE